MKTQWRKSSRSGNSGANCVEVRANGSRFEVRDSKLGDGSPIFGMSAESFVSLMRAAGR
ncbi:DUF397 domain-containing protein [Glycomyces salinus]|uniref:DUF397 domain-containing protein n=1 Tax=Glycomyces salinus TaxID=980294 RepID=UPI0018EBC6AD|nr:DUF397 domain-containing protein [Glycomyces salinus]